METKELIEIIEPIAICTLTNTMSIVICGITDETIEWYFNPGDESEPIRKSQIKYEEDLELGIRAYFTAEEPGFLGVYYLDQFLKC